MASRMLHYILAVEIANNVPIRDINRFIIGSLIPDASSHSDGSYDIAHFADTDKAEERIKKGINWSLFEHKYKNEILDDSLYIGYLCHLIADAIWFKQVADKYIRIYPKKDRMSYIKKGYKDFQKLNSLLVEEYSVTCPSLQITTLKINEVNPHLMEQLFNEFAWDFKSGEKYNKNDLQVYPYEAVIDFIDESVNVCIKEIIALRNMDKTINPYIYYVETRP